MEDFAKYILNEKDYFQKIIIAYYMAQKTGSFFDKSIVLRAEIARMFLNYTGLDVDKNIVLTAVLLCNCKKVDNSQKLGKLQTYAKEGAEYLSTLGFDKDFCTICEGLNRYSGIKRRKKESDILELVDQFTGLILPRPERDAFTPEEALIILKERNLKNLKNRYLEDFIVFVNAMDDVNIHDTVDVPVIRKLAFLTERENDVKSFVVKLANRYSAEIDRLMKVDIKEDAEKLLYNNTESEEKANEPVNPVRIARENANKTATQVDLAKEKVNKAVDTVGKTKEKIQTAHRFTRKIYKKNNERSLFSQEVADRVLNHETDFRIR